MKKINPSSKKTNDNSFLKSKGMKQPQLVLLAAFHKTSMAIPNLYAGHIKASISLLQETVL